MGLCSCHWILKLLLVVFNLVFGLCGLAGCVFAIWLLVDPTYLLPQDDSTDYIIALAIILVASILLVIIAFVGICGALKESQCLLVTFFSLLLIICVAELAATVWGYVNKDLLQQQVLNSVRYTVEQEYTINDKKREIFDTFQSKLHCCGAESPEDWKGNKQIILAVSSGRDYYKIPSSCCREEISKESCELATKILKPRGTIDPNLIYKDGCYSLILAKLKDHSCVLLGIGIALITIQVFALVFSLILAYMSKANRYKA